MVKLIKNGHKCPKRKKVAKNAKTAKKIQNINAHISETGRCAVLNIIDENLCGNSKYNLEYNNAITSIRGRMSSLDVIFNLHVELNTIQSALQKIPKI